jgi:oxygen-dependent protoporphyrinogen oxidase
MKDIIGKLNTHDKDVHIWGAGFSGLILGYYLKKQGYKVHLYEISNKIGGKIGTNKTFAGPAETGANAFYMNEDALELFNELKLSPVPASKKLKKLLLIDGKVRRPFHPSILSKLMFNLHKRPPLITDGLTVGDFFDPLMGKENVEKYVSPLLGGVYATASEKLHFKSVFGHVDETTQYSSYFEFLKKVLNKIKKNEQLKISGSVTFEGGMQTLINTLGENLKQEIKLNYKTPFELKKNTILCTDAQTASRLLSHVRPEISEELKRIHYQPLSTTTVFTKRDIKCLNKAFGILMPFESNLNSIGIINNKAIFPANHENINSYTFISRSSSRKHDLLTDIQYLQSDLSNDDVEHVESKFWENAIPVYDLQRYLSVKKIHQLLRNESGLAIFGNYVGSISLREMLVSAKSFSLKNRLHT